MAPDTPVDPPAPETERQRVERLLAATKLALSEHEAMPTASASYIRLLKRRVRRMEECLIEEEAETDALSAATVEREIVSVLSVAERAIANAVERERRS